MAGALRVLLYIYGAILVLTGLGLIFMPDQMANAWGVNEITNFAKFTGAGLGAIYLGAGVWVMVAGRDPFRHINWVKFVITKGTLSIVVGVYAIIVEYIDATPSMWILIADAILMVLFLVFYPWRAAHSNE